jgi:predicted phosphodiesterase
MKIGIVSDIHEDAESLQKALRLLEKENCDELVCLGDISGFDDRFYGYLYSKSLAYCIDLLIVNCRVIVPGNHDLYHLKRFPQTRPAFNFPPNWFELSLRERKKLSGGKLALYENERPVDANGSFHQLLADRADFEICEYDGKRILFSHSVFPDLAGILNRKPARPSDFSEHFNFLDEMDCQIGIAGHLHPNGLLPVETKKVHLPKFNSIEIKNGEAQLFVVPCVADGMQDNGVAILDTGQHTICALPLRNPRHSHSWL